MSEPAIFIGTDEQLAHCLRLAASSWACPSVHAGVMIEAADRIADLTALLATVQAERDAALSESLEQSRLLGMGGSREARLMAERNAAVARAEAADKWLAMAKSDTADYERVVTGMGMRRERAAIVAWLRAEAGKTRDDLTRLNRAKKLTHMMNAEWEAGIMTKAGIANAIEAGDHLPSAGDAGEG